MSSRLVHLSITTSEIEDFELKPRSDSEVIIDTLTSGISLGTEKKVALNQVPEKVQQLMRVPYMSGNFSLPTSYGYSLIGRVVEGDKNWLGKRIHCMHPHQVRCVVNKEKLVEVPDGISDEKATLLSNMETALNGFWDGQIKGNERILIIGFGLIGALVSGVIQIKTNLPVFVLETNPDRRKLAKTLGLKTVKNVEPNSFTIAFNTAGNQASIETAFDTLTLEGKLIELSWYGTQKVNIELGSDFHIKRLKIISSQVSHIPTHMDKKWNYKTRKMEALELLQNPWFDRLPMTEIPFIKSPEFFNQARNNQTQKLAYYFKY